MVTTKLNLSMTEPSVRQIYAKQGDTGRVLDITLDQTPEDGTLRILRPDGVEVTSEAVTGGEESGSTFESLTEADVTELTVGIEPVQDLNGYDKPWVGGAGKNLYNASALSTLSGDGITATVSNGTITLNGTATANAFFSIRNTGYASNQYTFSFNNPVANSGVHISFRDTNGNYFSDVSANTVNRTVTFTNEPSSLLLYVTSGTTLSNFTVKPQLELGSTATAWQPYSNICPITGHDEVTVTRTGINVWDEEWELGAIIASGSYPSTTNIRSKNYIPCMGGATYFSKCSARIVLFQYDGNKTLIRPSADPYIAVNSNNTFTTLTNARYMRFYTQPSYGTTYNNDISINYPSTDHDYHAYDGNTYTTSLGQTVYGGTLDMVSGVLTVTDAMVDLGSLSWIRESIGDGNRFRAPLAGAEVADYPSHITALCSAYPLIEAGQTAAKKQGFTIASNGNVYIYDGVQQSATGTDFKTAVTGTQLVYELATPQTVQLTPQQIKTLVGTNNVWASSGDIISIKFTYGGLLSELPSEATEIVGKCYCDVEQNGVSSLPFTLNVKKNERQ